MWVVDRTIADEMLAVFEMKRSMQYKALLSITFRLDRQAAMATATSLKIDDALKGCTKDLTTKRRRSLQWIMPEAMQEYVKREEARESFKQEALASWAAYQQTGVHLTGHQLSTWLNTWGTKEIKTVPECHK